MLYAFQNKVALIQGPPGTGKSFFASALVLVQCQLMDELDLGPVLVVSHSNQAVDELLEKVIKLGMTKVVRLGAGSKSDLLMGKSLGDAMEEAVLVRPEEDIRTEFRRKEQLKGIGKDIERALTRGISEKGSVDVVLGLLNEYKRVRMLVEESE